jgi:fructose-1,6-bisphosphatase/inositol monophosphatase family enzyme
VKSTTIFSEAEIMDPRIHELARTAVEAAVRAGDIQIKAFNGSREKSLLQSRDIKMAVDRECENAIVSVIRSRFPEHRILAEEEGDLGGSKDYLWIVDPLDGTVNFFHGLPQFCTCVACCRLPLSAPLPATGKELLDIGLVGVVYAPVMNELYIGMRNIGATLNGKPLNCADVNDLSQTIVALSFGKTDAAIDHMANVAGKIAHRAQKVRSYGCAGLDISFVAGGRLGGSFYRGIHLWDIAAAGIILAEAGGCLEAQRVPNGAWNMLAAPSGLYNELLEIVHAA